VSDEGGGGGPVGKTVPGQPSPEALATPAPAAGRPADQADVLARGTMVDGKYAVDRVLGQGGMGIVYLARDVHTGIEVVLKAIRPHLAHRGDVRERVIAEGRALAQIDHPNVVHLKAVVTDRNGLFLVMPYIDGESLDRTLKRFAAQNERMPVAEALRLFRMILAGVGAAHAEGVIHRDLKPANVLVRRKDGVAKVTDFGIAKTEEQTRAGQGQTKGVIGSLWYMSPEQVQGKRDLDKRVDVYSLGVVLFELLTGHVPFRGESSYDIMKAHVDQPLPSVRAERPDAPAWIDDVLARACAKSRDDRFPTCAAFLAAIDAAERAATAPIAGTASARAAGAADGGDRAAGTAPRPVLASDPAHASATGPAVSLSGDGHGPPRRAARPKAAPFIAVLGLLLVGGGVTAAYFLGSAGQRQRPQIREVSPWATASGAARGGKGSPIATAAPSASASAAPTEGPLASLAGRWKSESGRLFDAVLVGDVLEFRIVDPAQFAPQDYVEGEPRFRLQALEGEAATFAVEDKVRPLPPARSTFDSSQARLTCQENWREAGGRPLRATFDGTRLSVEAAKIEPTQANFIRGKGNAITSCVGLGKLEASVVRTVLTRP
jgi:serine/threonine-protein kinase